MIVVFPTDNCNCLITSCCLKPLNLLWPGIWAQEIFTSPPKPSTHRRYRAARVEIILNSYYIIWSHAKRIRPGLLSHLYMCLIQWDLFFPLSYHFHLILAYSCIMPRLTNESTVNLRTGRKMPRLGLGSGGLRDQTAVDAVEHAMKVGYLMGEPPWLRDCCEHRWDSQDWHIFSSISVDTAQQYQNERGKSRHPFSILKRCLSDSRTLFHQRSVQVSQSPVYLEAKYLFAQNGNLDLMAQLRGLLRSRSVKKRTNLSWGWINRVQEKNISTLCLSITLDRTLMAGPFTGKDWLWLRRKVGWRILGYQTCDFTSYAPFACSWHSML